MSNKVDDVERPNGCTLFLIALVIIFAMIGIVFIVIRLYFLSGLH